MRTRGKTLKAATVSPSTTSPARKLRDTLDHSVSSRDEWESYDDDLYDYSDDEVWVVSDSEESPTSHSDDEEWVASDSEEFIPTPKRVDTYKPVSRQRSTKRTRTFEVEERTTKKPRVDATAVKRWLINVRHANGSKSEYYVASKAGEQVADPRYIFGTMFGYHPRRVTFMAYNISCRGDGSPGTLKEIELPLDTPLKEEYFAGNLGTIHHSKSYFHVLLTKTEYRKRNK